MDDSSSTVAIVTTNQTSKTNAKTEITKTQLYTTSKSAQKAKSKSDSQSLTTNSKVKSETNTTKGKTTTIKTSAKTTTHSEEINTETSMSIVSITQSASVQQSTAVTSINNGITSTTTKPIAEESTTTQKQEVPLYCPTAQEMDMMCTVVSSEAGYCEDYMQKAVAHTIINRLYSNKFPDSIYEIVNQRNQYDCISNYYNGTFRKGLEPGTVGWQHTMELCYEVFTEWDFTGGAVAYYNPQMIGYNSWFEQFQCTYQNEYGRFFVI